MIHKILTWIYQRVKLSTKVSLELHKYLNSHKHNQRYLVLLHLVLIITLIMNNLSMILFLPLSMNLIKYKRMGTNKIMPKEKDIQY
jgi:high-affinity K+ transport system ATPase subunit B